MGWKRKKEAYKGLLSFSSDTQYRNDREGCTKSAA